MHEGYKQSIRLPDKTLLESEVMDFMGEMFLVWLSEERKISKEAFVKLDSDAQEAIVEEFTIFAMALGMVSGS